MVLHVKKPINSFYKDYSDNPIAVFDAIKIASLMAKPIIKPSKPTTQKQDWLANNSSKEIEKRRVEFKFYCIFGTFDI